MRQSLMQSFEQIYLLDLHGGTFKKERSPDGSEDENVFDIQRGVAIGLFIKKPGLQRKVRHSEHWGLRDDKYHWLEENDIATTEWNEIRPKSSLYLFVPRAEALLDRYEHYAKVTDIFPVNSVGIVTSRDKFAIDFDKETLKRRIRMFRDKNLPDELIRQTFDLKDSGEWKMPVKRKAIMADNRWEEKVTQILYRPFDVRWIFYHRDAIDRGRPEVMRHMLAGENVALVSARSNKSSQMDHFLCSQFITETKCGESTTQSCFFPLYPDTVKKDLFNGKSAPTEPNLDSSLLRTVTEGYGRKPTPKEVFHYIYAVLYSPTYRTKYAEFLKTDFPRVPFPRDRKLFAELGLLGKRLVDLHLLKSPALDPPIARFQGTGENNVEKQRYEEKGRRVYINKAQYFEGVEPEVWEYQIGGYQVLDKWLKDRKGRVLNLEDIRHYCRVVTALAKTIKIQQEIDVLYSEVESEHPGA